MNIKDLNKSTIIYFSLIILSFIFYSLGEDEIFKLFSIILLSVSSFVIYRNERIVILPLVASLFLLKYDYNDSYLSLLISLILLYLFNAFKTNIVNIPSESIDVVRNKRHISVNYNKLKVGDIYTLSKNDMCIVDSIVVNGTTHINSLYLNNKEDISDVYKNDIIKSGSLNIGNDVEVKVNSLYSDSKYKKMLDILSNSVNSKSLLEKALDNSIIFISSILLIVFVTLSIINVKYSYLSLIIYIIYYMILFKDIVSNVISNGIYKLFSKNIYFKNRSSFIKLMNIKNIYLNKTGVVTSGKLRITDVYATDEEKLFKYLILGEEKSDSFISLAIKNYKDVSYNDKIKDLKVYDNGIKYKYNKEHVMIGNYYFLKENGVIVTKTDKVGTIIYVVVDKKLFGSIIISDSIKKTNKENINKLKELGIKNIVLLSGDNEKIVKAIKSEIGVTDTYSNVNLYEKMFWFDYLSKKNGNNSISVCNYNKKNSSLVTDFCLNLDNNTYNFENYDIITIEKDIRILVELFKDAFVYKDILLKTLLFFALSVLINIILLVFNVSSLYIFVIINMLILNLIYYLCSK